MAQLTVGYVSGIIALCIFILQFLGPNLLSVVLTAGLKRRHTATTWAVVGRELQSSLWPVILRSDTAATRGVDGRVQVIGWAKFWFAVLLAVAGVVTPLGLYETNDVSSSTTLISFAYAKDGGPLGVGTQPRSTDNYFTRVCQYADAGLQHVSHYCPETEEFLAHNSTVGIASGDNPLFDVDVRVPESIFRTFQSGTEDLTTVSNFFDIEYRQLSLEIQGGLNGTYPIQAYQHSLMIVADEKFQLAEGLVVDTINQGVGFRNHTLPDHKEAPKGAEWIEDILFLHPLTECVNLNWTVEFLFIDNGDAGPVNELSYDMAQDLTLVDQGAFVNFDRDISKRETWFNKSQADPQLYDRAWLAAHQYTNLTMILQNISNLARPSERLNINSQLGQRFILNTPIMPNLKPATVASTSQWDRIISTEKLDSDLLNLTSKDVDEISMICSRSNFMHPEFGTLNNGGNINNLGIFCGTVYGYSVKQERPRTIDGYSWWSAPVYSCASGVQASIKAVHFRYAPDLDQNPMTRLSSLEVLNVEDKRYTSQGEEPFWAIENLIAYNVSLFDASPVWGIVSRDYANQSSWRYNTIQAPSLLLSAEPDHNFDGKENLPAADLPLKAIYYAYNVDYNYGGLGIYTGAGDQTIAAKWKELSQNASSVPSIINRIWVDYVANALVGTKSRAQKSNQPPNLHPPAPVKRDTSPQNASSSKAQVPVFLVEHQIRYRWVFAIPALITAAIFLVIVVWSIISATFSGVTPSMINYYLTRSSFGRVLTQREFENTEDLGSLSSRKWTKREGRETFSITPWTPKSSHEEKVASSASEQESNASDQEPTAT